MRVLGRALTGAWIETRRAMMPTRLVLGRALTGAWIETGVLLATTTNAEESRPHGRVD